MYLNLIFQALDGTGDTGDLSGTFLWGISKSYCVRSIMELNNQHNKKSGIMHHDVAKRM